MTITYPSPFLFPVQKNFLLYVRIFCSLNPVYAGSKNYLMMSQNKWNKWGTVVNYYLQLHFIHLCKTFRNIDNYLKVIERYAHYIYFFCRFYRVIETCVDDNTELQFCRPVTLEPCKGTAWSSFAPDPKSYLPLDDPSPPVLRR